MSILSCEVREGIFLSLGVMVVSSANIVKLGVFEISGKSLVFTRTNIGRKILRLGTQIDKGLSEESMPIRRTNCWRLVK